MTETEAEALRRRAEEIHASYKFGYAGKPRATRRLDELDGLVQSAAALAEETRASLGDDDLTHRVEERLALYRTEHKAIAEAQRAGPTAVRVTMLGARANFCMGQYGRHFAGQPRSTRDLALLDELVDELLAIQDEIRQAVASGVDAGPAENHLEIIARNVELYSAERELIVEAQNGTDGAAQTSIVAAIANRQFEAYRTHFAQRPRLSRRPALLNRIVGALEWCQDAMNELIAGDFDVETNADNRKIVRERLDAYSAERQAIAERRETTSVFELIDALGTEANEIMGEYTAGFAGQDRGTRDREKLRDLCDRLFEVERQMWALANVHDEPTNGRNLRIVHDTLLLYQEEFGRIREAQEH